MPGTTSIGNSYDRPMNNITIDEDEWEIVDVRFLFFTDLDGSSSCIIKGNLGHC